MGRLQDLEMTMAVGGGAKWDGGRGSSWRTRKWQLLGTGLKVLEMTTAAVTRVTEGNRGSFPCGCAGQWQRLLPEAAAEAAAADQSFPAVSSRCQHRMR